MDKFYNFEKYLINNKNDTIKLTYQEIEKIMREELCASAYKYKAYWNPSGHKNLSNIIYDNGYEITELELGKYIIIKRVKY